jgi:hypothetical protein
MNNRGGKKKHQGAYVDGHHFAELSVVLTGGDGKGKERRNASQADEDGGAPQTRPHGPPDHDHAEDSKENRSMSHEDGEIRSVDWYSVERGEARTADHTDHGQKVDQGSEN